MSIPQHSIYPCDSILLTPFSGVIFPLEGIHPDDDEISRVVVDGRQALCAESASHDGGNSGGGAAPMGGTVDGVGRVH